MSLNVQIVTGPSATKVSKEAAIKQLRSAPEFPKNAKVDILNVEGRWIAAVASVKEAEFPPSHDDADIPDAPELDDLGDSPDDSADPFSDDSDSDGDDKGSEKSEISHLVDLVTTLLDALGINPDGEEGGPEDGLIPDEEIAPPPPPAPGPAGPDENAGPTPVGAPAFASTKVAADHPWSEAINSGKHQFVLNDQAVGDQKLAEVKAELDSIASGTGYKVQQLKVVRDADGQRIAKVSISR